MICPLYEEGTLTLITFADDFEYQGSVVHVEGLEGCECDTCGADPILEAQIRRNHVRVANAKEKFNHANRHRN